MILARRRLIDGQVLRDIRGMKRVVGASIVQRDHVRKNSKFKFAEALKVQRPSVVSYICGPIGLLNGACWEHSNCDSMDFETANVMKLHTIEKGEELTFCYDKDEAVDVPGTERNVQCGYRGCRRVIIK